MLLVENTNN